MPPSFAKMRENLPHMLLMFICITLRRSISHPYILYKNAHNQGQTACSYAVRNDLGHYIVQMAWLAIKRSYSGSWMHYSLYHLLPWESNDTHRVNQVWWSELPLASGLGAHQFVARATNWQLSKHSTYGSRHTFGGQPPPLLAVESTGLPYGEDDGIMWPLSTRVLI